MCGRVLFERKYTKRERSEEKFGNFEFFLLSFSLKVGVTRVQKLFTEVSNVESKLGLTRSILALSRAKKPKFESK